MEFPETLEVVVLFKHIEEGIPGDESQCPIALAIYDQLWPNDHESQYIHNVEVLPPWVEIDGIRYTMPDDAREMAERFDEHGNASPATFTLTKVKVDV